jgi:MFS transporter, DHA1 family, inner membrane transport protein
MMTAPPTIAPPSGASQTSSAPSPETRWDIVALAIIAGVVCAIQVGKVPPALPVLRAELGIGFITAGWVASLVNICGGALGVASGLIIDWVGPRRVTVVSLLIMAGGGAIGAEANSAAMLLASRFLEGLGLVGTVVAVPAIIRIACQPADRNLALGLWGTYLPAGMAIALLAAPGLMEEFGWRGFWWGNVALVIGFAGLAAVGLTPRYWPDPPTVAVVTRPRILKTLSRSGPWLFSACFAAYALMFYAVAVWLPSYLIEAKGWTLAEAAMGGAVVVIANIAGNVISAMLMHRGVARWKLLLTAYIAYILCSWFIFAEPAPDATRLPAAMLFTLIGGLLPAACLAGGAAHAKEAGEVATMSGIIVQGSNTGSLLGAPVMALAVTMLGGWDQGYWVIVFFGTIGIAVTTLLLRPVEARVTVGE